MEMEMTASGRKVARLKYRRTVRMDLIDHAERQIEHFKSMIKNYKAQNKVINAEIGAEIRKIADMGGTTAGMVMA